MSTLVNYQESSKKISEITRYVVYGILGVTFAILTLRIDYFKNEISDLRDFLVVTIIFCVFSLLFDYFNILMQYINSRHKYRNKKQDDEIGIKWIYYLGMVFFYTKQILMILASIILIISLKKYI
jgi:hypothetical protein